MLGGGLVSDAVILLAGDPGVGKSTLLLHLAAQLARQGRRVLYVSGEESSGQIRLRAERMGALADSLFLASQTELSAVLGQIAETAPDVFIVDSVQTVSTDAVEGIAGGVSQVRTVTAVLTQAAKAAGRTALLVGHVTKDGAVAGPRTMEHLVDVVLTFEGDAALLDPDAARREEPVRRRGRGGVLRTDRGGDRRDPRSRAGCSSPTEPSRRRAPA